MRTSKGSMTVTATAFAVAAAVVSAHGAMSKGMNMIETESRFTHREATSHVIIAHLGSEGGDAAAFERIRDAFRERNSGYDVRWMPRATSIAPDQETHRIVFGQDQDHGEDVREVRATLHDQDGDPGGDVQESKIGIGDIILLRPGAHLETDGPIDFLVFSVAEALPEGLPGFIRPDWDDRITDTPGGCATEEGAYRRILLTWLETNGPYIYHGLNAHRVRITDSFSHYHPVEGGVR